MQHPPHKPVTVALIGIGGYGDCYLGALLDQQETQRAGVQLVGAVDPFPERSRRLDELTRRNVPVYPAMDGLFAERVPDLVVLASPIALHAEQTIRALESGSNVLCEKPLCATIEQGRQMLAARDRAERIVSIGYQWSFCDAICRLKRDIMAGLFGRPVRLGTLVLWPRDRRYYTRNSWAGRLRDSITNAPVFDSPVNNACAHFLHNMLYVLGDQVDRSATPHVVTAELYRANEIENYDTAALRATTVGGTDLLFFVSHATRDAQGPILRYEFEHATIHCNGDGPLVARFHDGRTVDYGTPASSLDMEKLWQTVRAVRERTSVACGIEASIAQTEVMAAAQCGTSSIATFSPTLIRTIGEGDGQRCFVDGLGSSLSECFDTNRLPSERNFAWAAPARKCASAIE